MEIKDIYKTIQDIFLPIEQPHFPDISRLLISFEDLGQTKKNRLIYFGDEKISFKERLPEYQEILINESLADRIILLKIYM